MSDTTTTTTAIDEAELRRLAEAATTTPETFAEYQAQAAYVDTVKHPQAVLALLDELARVRQMHAARCERVAAASEVLAKVAERDALGRLEAWEQAGVQKRVFDLSPWHAMLWDTDDCQAFAYASPRDREAICLDEGANVVIVGTDDKPATLGEMILAALDLWRTLHGDIGGDATTATGGEGLT
jgi:hypothetical protein